RRSDPFSLPDFGEGRGGALSTPWLPRKNPTLPSPKTGRERKDRGHPLEHRTPAPMIGTYRKAMDALYLLCVAVAGTSLVLISAVIPWAVYTRYVINQAASWPEPTAVLLTIVLTFFGAAACYRRRQHMNVSFFVDMLPPRLHRLADLLAELLMGLFAV